MKEKGVATEGEQDSTIAIENPSVAVEDQPSVRSSTVVQSIFRAELRAIKDKQVQQD